MSIAFSGTRRRSGGVISAIIKQLKAANLKPLKRITVRFNPFDESVKSARDFLSYISAPKVLATNIDCTLKADVVCDSSEPIVTLDFEQSDKKIIFKTTNLTLLEMLKLLNAHVSRLVPKEVEKAVTTKQKKLKKGKK